LLHYKSFSFVSHLLLFLHHFFVFFFFVCNGSKRFCTVLSDNWTGPCCGSLFDPVAVALLAFFYLLFCRLLPLYLFIFLIRLSSPLFSDRLLVLYYAFFLFLVFVFLICLCFFSSDLSRKEKPSDFFLSSLLYIFSIILCLRLVITRFFIRRIVS